MNKMKLNNVNFLIVFFLIFCVTSVKFSFSCTIFSKVNNGKVLVGNNEDYLEKGTRIWFYKKSPGSYGRMFWGFDRHSSPYQGGMNDQGLFVDINSIPHGTGWIDDPQKPNLPGNYIEHILVHCATVSDVVNLSHKFDIDLGWIKFFVADAQGISAIIEWLNGKVNVIYKQGNYQVSTNYTSPREPTEPRNQIASEILASQNKPTISLMRKALAATTYDISFGQTMYSTICDLKKKKIYLYHFHYFEEVVIFELLNELEKGDASYKIRSLFKIRTQNEHFFHGIGPIIGAEDLKKLINEEGIDKAVIEYYKMKKIKYKPEKKYIFEEWRLRSLGLNYLAKNKIEEARGIFKLITNEFPKSVQAYYDLADVYMKIGNKKKAIENYRNIINLTADKNLQEQLLKKIKNIY